VAQKNARHTTAPALILHGDGPALVPLDGSPEAQAALEPAARLDATLAAPKRGALHLLRVIQIEDAPHDTAGAAEAGLETLRVEGERYLHSRFQQERLAALSLDVTWSSVFDADVASAIVSAQDALADEGARGATMGCAMIAMASHGRNGVWLWMIGSVTDRVLQASDLPLLIAHPQGATIATARWEAADAPASGKVGEERRLPIRNLFGSSQWIIPAYKATT
jgi:nucleotide-binding universal stress UspA family protein